MCRTLSALRRLGMQAAVRATRAICSWGPTGAYSPLVVLYSKDHSPATEYMCRILSALHRPLMGVATGWSGADGGVFAFGDAQYEGSIPGSGIHSSRIVGIAPNENGGGYWLVATDGGVFAFGDAPFHGSAPGSGVQVSNIVGTAAFPNGQGYWLVGGGGSVLTFGSLPSDFGT